MATTPAKSGQRDRIDEMVERWAPELPPIDLELEALVNRIARLSKLIRARLEETVGEFGITVGEWHVLGYLRLAGSPYRRSPGQLAEHAQISSGAMTNRLDRLEQRGLIRRLPDPSDRRGIQVELTDEGADLWLRIVEAQAAKESVLASALSEQEKKQLNKLLRRAVLAFEPWEPDPADC
jgi:DNA-binding MarR family transcriptional regulator